MHSIFVLRVEVSAAQNHGMISLPKAAPIHSLYALPRCHIWPHVWPHTHTTSQQDQRSDAVWYRPCIRESRAPGPGHDLIAGDSGTELGFDVTDMDDCCAAAPSPSMLCGAWDWERGLQLRARSQSVQR